MELAEIQDLDLTSLARLGEAFGEPTRVRIYGLLSSSAVPRSAGELAEHLGLHRTVVRAHLERLSELGFLTCSVRHTGRGGRPAKTYAVAAPGALPERRHQWLADGLLELIAHLAASGLVSGPEAAASLEAAGEACGAGLRASLGLPMSEGESNGLPHGSGGAAGVRRAALRWLTAAGYSPELTGPSYGPVVRLHSCGFTDLAERHGDLVCAFDAGLLRGLFGPDERLRLLPRDSVGRCRLEQVIPESEREPAMAAAPSGE